MLLVIYDRPISVLLVFPLFALVVVSFAYIPGCKPPRWELASRWFVVNVFRGVMNRATRVVVRAIIGTIRLIRRSRRRHGGTANEHHCRRVAGGPFDLRGTLAGPLGLEARSCLLALDFFPHILDGPRSKDLFSTPAASSPV